jgi:hypothetical protein
MRRLEERIRLLLLASRVTAFTHARLLCQNSALNSVNIHTVYLSVDYRNVFANHFIVTDSGKEHVHTRSNISRVNGGNILESPYMHFTD